MAGGTVEPVTEMGRARTLSIATHAGLWGGLQAEALQSTTDLALAQRQDMQAQLTQAQIEASKATSKCDDDRLRCMHAFHAHLCVAVQRAGARACLSLAACLHSPGVP